MTGALAPAAAPVYASTLPPAVVCPTVNVCSQAAFGLGPVQSVALDGQGNAYVGNISGQSYKVDLSTGTTTILTTGLPGSHGMSWTVRGTATPVTISVESCTRCT